MNGEDSLAYYDIPTGVVVPFVAIGNPSAPTLTTNTGLTGTDFAITYRITANSTVNESASSNALSTPVSKDRDFWDPTTQSIKISWSAVSGARDYNVYMGTVAGFEYLIASGVNGLTYTDDGTAVQDTTRLFPTTNNTAGMKCSRGSVINGRAFLLGDKDNPYYVWNGGDPGFELDFSPANGGGNSVVGSGSKDVPSHIKAFRDGKGTPQITVFCEGTNGLGKRYLMTPDQLTFGSTVISFYDVTEDSAQDGTAAPDAIISYGTDLHYPSRDGFKTTGTLPQIQNVLSTKRTSNTIQPDLATLNQSAMGGAVGLANEGRLYFSLPVLAERNSQIWILDLDRKGAWMKPWSIPADWMLLYNDNSGNTHHLLLVNNLVYTLSYSALTNDDGEAFSTGGKSGQIYFSKDKRMWVQLLAVVIIVLSPKGEINFAITGKTEDFAVQALGEPYRLIADSATQPAGWGEVNRTRTGWGRIGWSEVKLVPQSTSTATEEVIIPIDEEVQWADWSWATSKVGAGYNISDVVFEYIETGIKDI